MRLPSIAPPVSVVGSQEGSSHKESEKGRTRQEQVNNAQKEKGTAGSGGRPPRRPPPPLPTTARKARPTDRQTVCFTKEVVAPPRPLRPSYPKEKPQKSLTRAERRAKNFTIYKETNGTCFESSSWSELLGLWWWSCVEQESDSTQLLFRIVDQKCRQGRDPPCVSRGSDKGTLFNRKGLLQGSGGS